MKIAFLSETPYQGKWPSDFKNARTEVAWQIALNADHYNIRDFDKVSNYDHVFIIFPKGMVYLNAIAIKMSNEINPVSDLLNIDFVPFLKQKNKKVHFVQEGPHHLWNDYEIRDQILYINMIFNCDSIFCHNEYDKDYYIGLFPNKKVETIPTLMIENLIKDIVPDKQQKVLIGGNFARWYGGFESYSIAHTFNVPIWSQDSHAKRNQEGMMDGLTHFPRMEWLDWMKKVSEFKYAVHLMPTVAAGTFSLNCAYFGIPCIGNEKVDTQNTCHPELSVDVADLNSARKLAVRLLQDKKFYDKCSNEAKENYNRFYSIDIWLNKMNRILNEY